MIDEGRALFLQIAESVEDSIIDGALAEEAQAPSTNELAAFYRINPATAAKGIAMLTDKGVLYKRRGIGMFVSPGARALLLAERRAAFVERFLDPLLAEARTLGLAADDLARLLAERRSSGPPTRQQRKEPHDDQRDRGEAPHQALPRHRRSRRRELHDREGHDLRPPGSERSRQDHGHVDPHGAELRHERRRPRLRRAPVRERQGAAPHVLRPREPEVPRRREARPRVPDGAALLRELGPDPRRSPHRRLPAADEQDDQEALARPAQRRRRDHRPGIPRGDHLLRRALSRTRRRRPPALLRPPARGLRRAPAHDHPVEPPDRRGVESPRAGDRHRRRPDHHGRGDGCRARSRRDDRR